MDVLERKRRSTMLKQVFHKMDADCSGTVELQEFYNLREDDGANDEGLFMIYHYLDEQFGDGDGSLSLDEWLMGMRAVGEEMGEAGHSGGSSSDREKDKSCLIK